MIDLLHYGTAVKWRDALLQVENDVKIHDEIITWSKDDTNLIRDISDAYRICKHTTIRKYMWGSIGVPTKLSGREWHAGDALIVHALVRFNPELVPFVNDKTREAYNNLMVKLNGEQLGKKEFFNQPTKEEEVNMSINIVDKVRVNGVDIDKLSDDTILNLIANQNTAIDALKAVNPLPKKFQKKLKQLEEDLAAFIKLMDDMETK